MKISLPQFVFKCAIVLLAWMGMNAAAYGRLGETVEQCVARYGEVAGKVTPQLQAQGSEACLFTPTIGAESARRQVLIRVEFHNGQACYIRFTGKLNSQEMKEFRDKAVGASPWDGPEAVNDRSYWRSKATKTNAETRYACAFGGGEKKHVEIFTSTYVKLLKTQAAKQEKAILSTANWDPINATNLRRPEGSAAEKGPASSTNELDKF